MTEVNHIAEIAKAISAVMKAVDPVAKRGVNEFHRYQYATAADLVHALQKPMAEAGLIVVHSEASRSVTDGLLEVTFNFHIAHSSGAVWPHEIKATGIAAAKTSKGSPDDKAWNKCLTAAHKYFLVTLFKVPTGDFPDADADGDVPQPERKVSTPATQKPVPQGGAKPDVEVVNAAAAAIAACLTIADLNQLWSMSAAAWRGQMTPDGYEYVTKAAATRKAELTKPTLEDDEIPY
jgi:hypothetical protein